MKIQSEKRAKLMRDVLVPRTRFREKFPWCWCCGSPTSITIHEMLRGGSRGVALPERCCWFAACWLCNTGDLDDATLWPVKRQLAVKYVEDPGGFDLQKFLSLKREAATSITFADLKPWIRKERKARE